MRLQAQFLPLRSFRNLPMMFSDDLILNARNPGSLAPAFLRVACYFRTVLSTDVPSSRHSHFHLAPKHVSWEGPKKRACGFNHWPCKWVRPDYIELPDDCST